MRKIITFFLAFVMMCTVFSGISAFAEEAEFTYSDHLDYNNDVGYDYDISTATIAWVAQSNGALVWVKADDTRSDDEVIAAAKEIDNSLDSCVFSVLRGVGFAETPNTNGSQAMVNVIVVEDETVLSIEGKYSHFVMGYYPVTEEVTEEPEETYEPEVYEPEVFEPEIEEEPIVKGDKAVIRIDAPQKMAVAFADGTVYYGGEMKEVVVGEEYPFRMCSVNWDNGIYDGEDNGISGTVVYRMIPAHRSEFLKIAKEAKADTERYVVKGIDVIDTVDKIIYVNVDAEDTHLETDVNSFFMAYRFSFEGENYDKKTGIAGVINTPVESLSVNLPLGSTIDCDAYIEGQLVASDKVYITNNSGEGMYDDVLLTSVNDYVWNLQPAVEEVK